jgi:isopenicillin-N epimerase
MKFAARRSGATYREIDIPLPAASAAAIAERVISGLSDRTRVLVLDHVTSPTALVFPLELVAKACAECGVDLLVDGAHAPGMLPLDLTALGAIGVAWYTGNLHKWCGAPKGTAFLWARADRAADVHPAVISHWYGEGLSAEFHWQGTRDHAGWLCAGAAIDFLARFGWDHVRAHNRAMATWAHTYLCDRLNVEPISPRDGSLLGSMATMRLPPPLDAVDDARLKVLQQMLYDDYLVEAPLISRASGKFFRVSCPIYTTPREIERLAEAIEQLKRI